MVWILTDLSNGEFGVERKLQMLFFKSNIVYMKESFLLPKGTQRISKLASLDVAKA